MSIYKPSYYNIVIENGNEKIVFNAISGAIAKFNDETLEKMLNVEVCSKLEETALMVEKGFLVPDDLDEWSKLYFDRQCFIFNPSPSTIGFVITPTLACNMKCAYCFENDGRELSSMSEETMYQTLNFIKSEIQRFPTLKDVSIVWFGGEPCLKSNLMIKFSQIFIPFLKDKGLKYYSRIATNGVLLNRELALKLKETCGVVDAQITIDGLASTYAERKKCSTNDFYTLIDNITKIYDIIKINIRINVDYDNCSEIATLLKYLLNDNKLNGKINIYFAQIQNWNGEIGRNYIDDLSYIEFLKNIHSLILKNGWEKSFSPKRPIRQVGPCGSMRNTNATIGPDGLIYRCEHCLNKPEWKIGDIEQGKYCNATDMTFLCNPVKEKCKKCKAFPICSGGCLANEILHGLEAVNCMNYLDIIKENVLFAVHSREKAKNC